MDTEFTALPGERSTPICLVARDINSGRTMQVWEEEFGSRPPFPITPDALFVAFVSTAEFSVFRSLGWQMPARVLDLSVEYRNHTSGIVRPHGLSLLGALAHHGLDVSRATEKKQMQKALGMAHGVADTHAKKFSIIA